MDRLIPLPADKQPARPLKAERRLSPLNPLVNAPTKQAPTSVPIKSDHSPEHGHAREKSGTSPTGSPGSSSESLSGNIKRRAFANIPASLRRLSRSYSETDASEAFGPASSSSSPSSPAPGGGTSTGAISIPHPSHRGNIPSLDTEFGAPTSPRSPPQSSPLRASSWRPSDWERASTAAGDTLPLSTSPNHPPLLFQRYAFQDDADSGASDDGNSRQGPPAASPLFRTVDEFEDAAWDDPTTMVPKHLLLFTTSLPELPRWSRHRVRSPSPTPRPSAVGGVTGSNSFSNPSTSQQAQTEKKMGKVRPQSVNFGLKLAEGDPLLDVGGLSSNVSRSASNSLQRPASASSTPRGSRARTASGAPDVPQSLKGRRRSSNRSASRTPNVEGSGSTMTQVDLDVMSTLLERARQVKNHRWKAQQPVAVWPPWQEDAPPNFKYSREGSFSDSPALAAVPPAIIPTEFRAPSPMFMLDDDDDDDDSASNVSGSTGRSGPRAASPFLTNVVRGPRRTSRTRKALGVGGAGGARGGRSPSPPPSPDASSVSSVRTNNAGAGGGVTINRSLSDGDLSDYLKGFSELKDSLRVAKSTCNAEVQRIIVELQEFVEDHLQYNEDEPLRRKSNDDISYRRLSTSTTNLYSPREIPDPTILARSGSTPHLDSPQSGGGGYFAYTPSARPAMVQTPTGMNQPPQSSPSSPSSGRSPRPSITKLHESVASDLCLAADEDAKTAPLTQAIHDLISIAQNILEMDLASLMTPGACRDIISRLLGLQAKWAQNAEWPCRGHVLRLLMVFASVARMVEHLEEDTRISGALSDVSPRGVSSQRRQDVKKKRHRSSLVPVALGVAGVGGGMGVGGVGGGSVGVMQLQQQNLSLTELRAAADAGQSVNVMMEFGFDGTLLYISPSSGINLRNSSDKKTYLSYFHHQAKNSTSSQTNHTTTSLPKPLHA
ncbi:hypothetical protein HDV00_009813 [Rhizophlyctis rosea]|nr:hypothetical protein HDV00_009813 [Rhizophlyctis rosea]